uniref:Receptor-like serine/threonine-protein kinase n=1 Tax=Lactuca sativa TaxID=4236 RepID=A0A9R1WBK0_LACSA|nr:hypothetical protein LSAT_V11C200073840 [Lactuca sativa]
MADRGILLMLILALSCYSFSSPSYSKTDTLQQGQILKDWDELISPNTVFFLKFFSFGTSISPYLGIFYNPSSGIEIRNVYSNVYDTDKPVWVANRNNPITDIYGKLMIDVHGKLSILSGGGTVVDLFSPTTPGRRNASATLLDNGNFILQELYPDGSVKRILWQSFDYPTDTLLPGMKLGIDHKTGHRWSLTSWRRKNLPADGSFTLTGDSNGTGQMVIVRRGNIHWRSGSWKNGGFINTGLQYTGPDVRPYYVSNETELSFAYLAKTYLLSPALTMLLDGRLKGSTLNLDVKCRSISDISCAEYEFEELSCRKEYFVDKRYGSIYGDHKYEYDESHNLSLYDCQRICWNKCSCMAFTYATTDREGCTTYGPKIYNPQETETYRYPSRQRIYNLQEAEKQYYIIVYNYHGRVKKELILTIGIGSLASLVSCYFLYKKLRIKDKKMNTELHHFTFQSISSATNNFSSTNKLGEGGFGAVYKGKLVDGQEVAVKRLSRNSEQGVKEFKNETELIAKLQHTNLVRLIGCCIEKKEKILVYEYMPNHSLDFFLFGSRKKGPLDWNNRFVIIDGIAQGLLYLHRFSRLRVIHRDLKASNILLDDYLKPKISDFGMAKLFGINESEANTSRVVGTRGYMPPEYMLEGSVSTKTDVFGFGVLLLEIVSSKMNHGSYDTEHPLNLLGHAWELWNEGRGLELMDPLLEDSCAPKEVMTCIHVGLLCVQDHAMDRPTMSEVISMLTNENMHLPEPKRPAFFIERHEVDSAIDDNLRNGSINGQSVSILVAR